MEKLLSITNLKKYFPVAGGSIFAEKMYVRANEPATRPSPWRGTTISDRDAQSQAMCPGNWRTSSTTSV